MEIIDPTSVKKISVARDLVTELQKRLFKCEEKLDDLARAVEIAVISGQYNLIHGFLQDAREQLVDRLTLPSIPEADLNKPLTIIEDDRDSVSSKSA